MLYTISATYGDGKCARVAQEDIRRECAVQAKRESVCKCTRRAFVKAEVAMQMWGQKVRRALYCSATRAALHMSCAGTRHLPCNRNESTWIKNSLGVCYACFFLLLVWLVFLSVQSFLFGQISDLRVSCISNLYNCGSARVFTEK